MLPSAFQGGGVQGGGAQTHQWKNVADNLQNIGEPLQPAGEDRPSRTVTFQNSYDVLTRSTSTDEVSRGDPDLLISFWKDPQLEERKVLSAKLLRLPNN